MKKLLLLAALVSAPALANKKCDILHAAAKQIMQTRQLGVDMPRVLAVADSGKGEQVDKDMRKIVIAAYDVPRFNTDANKEKATADFANDMFLLCLKGGFNG